MACRQRPKLDTNLVTRVRADSGDEAPQSVIHAPPGFKNFVRASQTYMGFSSCRLTVTRMSSNQSRVAAGMRNRKQEAPRVPS